MIEGKVLFDGGIKSQPVAAVENLSKYLNREINSGMLDMGRMKLVLSGDKKSYYAVSATDCSCPAKFYNHGQPCKHQRQHFPQGEKPAATETGSIRPTGKWPGGHNGPVDEIKGVA